MFLEFLETLSTLDGVVAVALVTGVVSLASVLIAKIIETRQTKKRYLYEKREPSYKKFITIFYGIAKDTASGKAINFDIVIEDMWDVSESFMLWGSNKVIKKYLAFRKNTDSKKTLQLVEDIIFAMRKDLGYSKFFMKKGDILGIISDEQNGGTVT